MSMRWKMDEREKGLRSIVQGPRGYWLRDGETRLAHVSALGKRGDQWYWVAGWDADRVPHKNTLGDPVNSVAEAKAQAMAYVKLHLKATTQPEDAGHD
jgi:hypothetical protein